MKKKNDKPVLRKKIYKLFIFYKPGLDVQLDERIEKAVGVGATSQGYFVIPPYERDLQFQFDTKEKALEAAKRVGVLSLKLKREIKYNVL